MLEPYQRRMLKQILAGNHSTATEDDLIAIILAINAKLEDEWAKLPERDVQDGRGFSGLKDLMDIS